MTIHSIKKYILAGSLLAAAAVAQAVPARPAWRTVTQPDGSELTVRTMGDERFHFTVTSDNRLVAADEAGVWHFATVDDRGAIVPTQFVATEEAKAGSAARDFLAKNPTSALIERSQSMRAAAATFKSPARVPDNMLTSSFPSTGEQPVLVVLVEYKDVKFEVQNPEDYYHRMLNEQGFSDDNGTGSARDYFIDSSNGKFLPRFDVYGPITLANNMAYYGGNDFMGNDLRPEEMAIEACQAIDGNVDFTQYDCDGDGVIDNVFVIYAGKGEADGGSASSVWPHAFWIKKGAGRTVYLDGKLLDHYACSNEVSGAGVPNGIGTTVHEFSHVMGLPDLYATDYSSPHTPCDWSVLDSGSYLNDGRTPPAYSSFERLSMGWIDPIELTETSEVMIPDLKTNVAFILPTADNNEFFLFENRQRSGWDSYLPYHGMLIWRISYSKSLWTSNAVNNSAQHVDVIEAGNPRSKFGVPYAATSDPWPGSLRKTTFSSTTSPAFTTLAGTPIETPLTAIAEDDGKITFSFDGGTSRIAAPQAVAVDGVTGRTASVTWQPVAGAKGYLLTVDSPTSYIPVYNHVHVGDVTTFDIEGLEPETAYTVNVMAIGTACVSDESTTVAFTTTDAQFTDRKVIAEQATDVTADSFTARWQYVAGADSYLLTVNKVVPATNFEEIATFDDAILPEGWTTTAGGKYVIPSNCGQSAPALRLNKPGENIITSVKAGDITQLSLWVRATNAAASENKLAVYGLTSTEAWEKISDIILSTTGRTVDLPIEKGYHAIKLEYTGNGDVSCPIAVDDIYIKGGEPSSSTKLVDALNVGDVTAYTVTGLDLAYTYSYTVTAVQGEAVSLPSDAITVTLDANASGIDDITAADDNVAITGGYNITIAGTDADAVVYNMQGLTVYTGADRTINVPAGLYIVKAGAKVAKVIVY